ncbi:MAG: ABC transporter permease [Thiohalomonadales bacterium]
MIALGDLKYAIRLLCNNSGFTILTILVMATGIGLSLFLFSFLNTMAFKTLPFKDGESLVVLNSFQKGFLDYGGELNLHDYYEIRTTIKGLSEFGAYTNSNVNVSGRNGAKRYNATYTEPNIFQLTRTKPILGREFTSTENQMYAEYVVVIGYDMWQNQFSGVPDIINQKLRINGESHRIIGVMPSGYSFPNNAEMWIPMREDATKLTRGNARDYFGIAHLNNGVSKQDINHQLLVIMQRIEEKYPVTNNDKSAYVLTLHDSIGIKEDTNIIYLLYVVAIFILILAAINVGNLLLSRAIERSKETAIRVALGAQRSRLIGQMLWESIIICSIGGIIGLLLTAWGLETMEVIVTTFSYDRPPFWWKFGIDSYTIKIFFYFVLGTIIITGLLPAWRNSGADFNAVLRDGTRGALGKKAGSLNRLLVISEIFLSVTVLITAGVIVVGSYIITHADYGADTENILTAEIVLPDLSYDSPVNKTHFAKTLQSRLENNVGIGDVMISSALPGVASSTPLMVLEGNENTEVKENSNPRANYISVSTGSLAKLGIELMSGRYFNSDDDGLEKKSVIVTDSFVSRYIANESPIGKRIRIIERDGEQPDWLTIVGVVEHTIQGEIIGNDRGKIPSVFRPFSQAPRSHITVAMQMKSDRYAIIQFLRQTLSSIDPELPAFQIETYTDKIDRIGAPAKFLSTVFLLFSIAALVLAASGIYGVMSNIINQRTQEIGVKRAFGALEQQIIREFLITGFKQLLWGGLPGLLAGSAMGIAISKTFGAGNYVLLIIILIMISVVGSVVMLATWLPTKRALKMEPGEALRYE